MKNNVQAAFFSTQHYLSILHPPRLQGEGGYGETIGTKSILFQSKILAPNALRKQRREQIVAAQQFLSCTARQPETHHQHQPTP